MSNILMHSSKSLVNPSQSLITASNLTDADIEQLADEMLAGCVRFGATSGIYTQLQLDRKVRRERKRVQVVAEDCACAPMIESVVGSQLNDLIDAARLNSMEEIICRFYVAGFTGKRMAEMLGVKRSVVKQRLRIIKRRIRAAYLQGPYAGWYEVYLSEVNRLSYRSRRH